MKNDQNGLFTPIFTIQVMKNVHLMYPKLILFIDVVAVNTFYSIKDFRISVVKLI